jgi:hypothetical protein
MPLFEEEPILSFRGAEAWNEWKGRNTDFEDGVCKRICSLSVGPLLILEVGGTLVDPRRTTSAQIQRCHVRYQLPLFSELF